MSTGGQGEQIGAAFVAIDADLRGFDAAVATLPKKAAARMDEAMRALQARAAAVKIDLKTAYNAGDLAAQQKLIPLYDQIRGKIEAVEFAAAKQAQAHREAGRAAEQAATAVKAASADARAAKQAEAAAAKATARADVEARRDAARAAQQAALAPGQFAASVAPKGMTDAAMAAVTKAGGDPRLAGLAGGLSALGAEGKKAGEQIHRAGMSGAMGLMVLSQTIDDAQYGFRSIVNNIPSLGMGLAGMLGMTMEAGLKMGAVAGIAGVAINLLITHWDQLMKGMGFGKILTEAEEMEALAKATERTAEETLRLAKYERERTKAKQLGEARPTPEKEAGARVEKAIVESDAGKVRGALMGQLLPPVSDEQEKRIAKAWSFWKTNAEAREAEAKKVDEERNKAAGAEADKIMARAALGDPKEVARLRNIAARAPGAFPRGLGEGLKRADIGQVLTEQGLEVQAEMHERSRQAGLDLTRQGREQEQQMGEERAARRDVEAGRLAGAMDRSVGTKLLLDPKMAEADLEARVGATLKAAGVAAADIGKLVPEIAVKLRNKTREAIEGRATEQGISKEQARVQLLKEERERDKADQARAGNKAELLSDKSYFDRLFVSALNAPPADPTPKEQLKAQQDANKKLDELVKAAKERAAPQAARFGGGGMR